MSGNSIGFGEEINKLCKKCVMYACLSGARFINGPTTKAVVSPLIKRAPGALPFETGFTVLDPLSEILQQFGITLETLLGNG